MQLRMEMVASISRASSRDHTFFTRIRQAGRRQALQVLQTQLLQARVEMPHRAEIPVQLPPGELRGPPMDPPRFLRWPHDFPSTWGTPTWIASHSRSRQDLRSREKW